MKIILLSVVLLVLFSVEASSQTKVTTRIVVEDYNQGFQKAFLSDGSHLSETTYNTEGRIILPEEYKGKSIRIRLGEEPSESNVLTDIGNVLEFEIDKEDLQLAMGEPNNWPHYPVFVFELENIRMIKSKNSNNSFQSTRTSRAD